jgi:hypothetical protein
MQELMLIAQDQCDHSFFYSSTDLSTKFLCWYLEEIFPLWHPLAVFIFPETKLIL